MSSAEEVRQQLDLRHHNLDKIDWNQARLPASSENPNPKNIAHKSYPSSKDELQLNQMKLPLKLPQRRKFVTLAEVNSANFGLKFHYNLENFSSLGSSAFQKALDPAMAKGQEEASKQVELPAIGESKEEACYEAVEMLKTKKKLLAQLAEIPGAVVDSQPKIQQNESHLHRRSNPSRICRFCGREFSSGRALGGHMRVHGALLFADTSSSMAEQEEKTQGEAETFGSVNQLDTHLCRKREVEEMKPSSFTSSSNSSQMNSERPNQAITLDRHGQEDVEEEEEPDIEEGEKVARMVKLSSFECTSVVNKPDELLGCGYEISELLTDKKKPASALYELRQNPKPNQRFFRDQERRSLSYAIWHSSSAAGSIQRSRSPSPERERACSECGKVFSSWKALFGHMRCHPERDWRGIQPPERMNSEPLDRTVRSTTPKASCAPEISSAENIASCDQPQGSVLSNAESKEKGAAKLNQDVSTKSNVLDASFAALVPTRETTSSVFHKWGACTDMESRQFRDVATKIEQGEDNVTQAPAASKECKKSSKKRVADHVDHTGTKDVTKTWSPISWCSTGKRSKRNRSGALHHELSLTSEATSIELRLSQHDTQLADKQEDLDMANCLVLLSSAGVNKQEIDRMDRYRTEESTFLHQVKKRKASLSRGICSERLSRADMGALQAGWKVDDHVYDSADDDDACYEAETKIAAFSVDHVEAENHVSFSTEVKYQCSTCKKCFNSHQALGGHRASHKKMKGCFAQTKNLAKDQAQESSEEDNLVMEHIRWQSMVQGEGHQEAERSDVCVDPPLTLSPKKKIKGHECSICHRIFASGQALGGHKRCHWNGERYVADAASVASSNKQSLVDERSEWAVSKSNGIKQLAKEDTIDLNLPAPFDEDDEAAFDNLPASTQTGTEGMFPSAAKEEEAVNSLMDWSFGAARKQISGHEGPDWKDWTVNDLLREASGSSSLHATRENEGRFRFNRRPPMWNHKWDDAAAVGAQIPQVCSLKTL